MLNFNIYDTFSYFFPPTNRNETIHEIEEKTPSLNKTLDLETINVLKEKITELEESNRVLEVKKEELLKKRKCCDLRLITWIRWGLAATLAASMITGIARLALKYSQDATVRCLDDRLELLGDLETYFLFLFGATEAAHEVCVSKKEHDQIEINEASIIEKFGDVSYKNYLEALHNYKNEQNIDRLKTCIQILDEMPKNRITEKIIRQKLIPNLLCMLPNDNNTYQQFMRIVDSETISTDDSFSDDSSNRFLGEKASQPHLLNNNNKSPEVDFKSPWAALEDDLGTRLNCLQYENTMYYRDGNTTTIEQEFTIIEIGEE